MNTIIEGREALSRLRRVGQTTWADWLLVAHALAAGREQAMKTAGTNRPFGPKFTRAMRHWIDANGFGELMQTERYACQRLLENLPAITAWRDSLDENRRLRNNHPHGVYWAWRRSLNLAPPLRRLPSAKMITGKAHSTGYHRPLKFDQAMIKRAGDAMRQHWSNDCYRLAAIALSAALRHEIDLLELLPDAPQSKPAPLRIEAPPVLELVNA